MDRQATRSGAIAEDALELGTEGFGAHRRRKAVALIPAEQRCNPPDLEQSKQPSGDQQTDRGGIQRHTRKHQHDDSGWQSLNPFREERQLGGDPSSQHCQGGSGLRDCSPSALAYLRDARRAAHELGIHPSTIQLQLSQS